ncbi:MAG TPA: hypothetical protein VF147_03300, partial [Vicinamibacterales bacterium]
METVIEPVPPEADKVEAGASIETAHLETVVGETTVPVEDPHPAIERTDAHTAAIPAVVNTRAAAALVRIVPRAVVLAVGALSNVLPWDTAGVGGGQWSMFNAQCSMLNGQCSMVSAQCSVLNWLWVGA